MYEPWKPIKERIIGSSGAVDVTLAVLAHAVEATIEVVVVMSEVQSGGLGLSLSSLVDVMDVYEEIQLFDGIIAQSVGASKKVRGCRPDLYYDAFEG